MRRLLRVAPLLVLGALACASGSSGGGAGPNPRANRNNAALAPRSLPPVPPPLPDSSLWGTQVLVAARAPDTAVWVGTYGRGIFVFRNVKDNKKWDQILPRDKDSTSLAWSYVNALGFTPRAVWYGTVGNGFGRSTDGGRTWHNWTLSQLGPAWQYVAPDGIRTRGDTVYIATADGLRITWDGGDHWRCIEGPPVPGVDTSAEDAGCTERIPSLPTEYLLSLDLAPDGAIWVGHLKGLSVSRDGGRTWKAAMGVPPARVRSVTVTPDSAIWAATETGFYRSVNLQGRFDTAAVSVPGLNGVPGDTRALIASPYRRPPAIASSHGLLMYEPDSTFHAYFGSGERYRPAADLWTGIWTYGRLLPLTGSSIGIMPLLPIQPRPWDLVNAPVAPAPAAPRHPLFRRPIDPTEGNPYIDATYRYGSTMGGNFQQHEGVEFNNPEGTPVHAIGDGVVVFAGKAEAGANTVAILHDEKLDGKSIYSVYYHNTALKVQSGQRVRAGDVISLVGHTGRATNDHLHLEVHVAPPGTDSSKIVNAAERFPPYTVNPQLWIEPMPGDGIVTGRVLDAAGNPAPGLRVYGLVLPYPAETPYAFAETYMDKAHPDPSYDDNFAVGDVPAGRYLLGVDYGGGQVAWRTVDVAAGKVSFVEFRPPVAVTGSR